MEIAEAGYYRILGEKSGDYWKILDESRLDASLYGNQTYQWAEQGNQLSGAMLLDSGTYYVKVTGTSGDKAEFKLIGQELGTSSLIRSSYRMIFLLFAQAQNLMLFEIHRAMTLSTSVEMISSTTRVVTIISGGSGYNTLVVDGAVDDYSLYGELHPNTMFRYKFTESGFDEQHGLRGLTSVLTNGTDIAGFKTFMKSSLTMIQSKLTFTLTSPRLTNPARFMNLAIL